MGAECGSGQGWRGGKVRAWKVPDKRWEVRGGVWKGECWDKLGGISTPVCTKDKGGRHLAGAGRAWDQVGVGCTYPQPWALQSDPAIVCLPHRGFGKVWGFLVVLSLFFRCFSIFLLRVSIFLARLLQIIN